MNINQEELLLINEAHLYLSKERSLYVGRVGECMKVSRAPSAFIIALDGEICVDLNSFSGTVHNNAQTTTVRSIVLPADCSVELSLDNALIAIFFLDFLGEDFSVLKRGAKQIVSFSSGDVIIEPDLTGVVSDFVSETYLVRKRARDVFAGLESIVSDRRRQAVLEGDYVADKRIIKAIHFIRTPLGLTANIDEISQHVSLSVPRFTQLFRLVTGISVRRFKIWYRMYLASELLAQGKSFTEAAVGAGFSDYAHFSRSFTEMGGVAPSVMLYGSQDLYVDVYYREKDTDDLAKSSKSSTTKEAEAVYS